MAFGGTIKLQGEQEYRQALKKITDDLKVVGTELAKVSSQFGKNETSVESLTAKNKVLTDKLNEQKKALDLTRDMLDKAKAEYDKSVQSVADLKDELSKAQTALEKAKSSTNATAEEIAELEGNVNDLKNKLSDAEKETGAYETTVKKWTSEVNKAETAVNHTTREINENKSAIDKLSSATDNATDDIDDLSGSMKDASKKTDDLSDDLDDLEGATKKAGDGFTVFKGVLADLVSNGINFVMNGIHDLVGEAISASDTMYKFEQTMGFAGYDSSVIEEASDRVKDYADKTVYNLDTIANTTAQLAANGIKDYSGLTEALGNLNAVAGGNADTFNSISIALTQTAGAGKLTTENWNQLANAIPGASGKLQEALKEAGAYTGDFREAMAKGEITADEFNAAIMKLGNEPVAVEAATSVATFEGAIGNMQAAVVSGLQEIISEIGMENITGFLTSVTDLIGKVIKTATTATKWVKKNLPAVLTLVTGLLTAFTAQVIANKVAVIAATAAEKGMTIAQYAAATAQKALNLAMAANPIGLIIAGITALVAGFMLLWNNCEDFRNFWIGIWENIKTTFSGFVESFKIGWEMISDVVQVIVEKIVGVFTTAWNIIQTIWNVAVKYFKGIFDGIKAVFTPIAETLSGFFKAAWNGIKIVWDIVVSYFKTIWENIKTIFSVVKDILGGFFKAAWDSIKVVWDLVVGYFKMIWENIKAIFSVVKSVLSGDFSGAWEGIKSIWNNVKGYFQDVWNGIKTIFGNVISFFKDSFSRAWEAVKNVFSNVGSFFGGIWDTIKSKFTSIGTKVGQAIGGAFKSAINAVIGTVEGAINAIPRAVNGAISAINKLPGVNISKMSTISLPRLAKGTVTTRPMIAEIGEAGAEAVVPLENNTGWIRRIADELKKNLNGISSPYPQTYQNAAEIRNSELSYTTIVSAFKDALKGVKVEMDSDEMGRFVEKTVADAIYT